MADQARWFKLWCSAPSDDDLQALPVADRWAWVVLGAYTKLHGDKGIITISESNLVLAGQMGVHVQEMFACIRRLPHMTIEEGKNRHDTITVTWHNWTKYQIDSTQSKRQQTSRLKKRGEEKRLRIEEKELRSTGRSTAPAQHTNGGPPTFHIPISIQNALDRCPRLNQAERLHHPPFWQAQLRANPGVDFASELIKAEAWIVANPTRAPRNNVARFIHNWMARVERGLET